MALPPVPHLPLSPVKPPLNQQAPSIPLRPSLLKPLRLPLYLPNQLLARLLAQAPRRLPPHPRRPRLHRPSRRTR